MFWNSVVKATGKQYETVLQQCIRVVGPYVQRGPQVPLGTGQVAGTHQRLAELDVVGRVLRRELRRLSVGPQRSCGLLPDLVDQTDLSGRWPLGNNLHVVGRWIYSFRQEETTTAFAGFEYDTCCWRARFVAQQLLTNIEEDPRTSFFVQLELKGLAKIGHGVDRYLEENIIGYRTD